MTAELQHRLLVELEVELSIALRWDVAVGRELSAVFRQLEESTGDEIAILAATVRLWRETNRDRAHADADTTATVAPAEKELAHV